MNILNDLEKIKKLDKSDVYQSIDKLDEQCWDAWKKVQALKIPSNYQNFSNIVICGMGGSCLGADVVRTLYQNDLKTPLVRVRDYHLPGFVNEKTLIVLSSYSGNTEETITCAKKAIKRKLKAFILTNNGKLEALAKENNLPFYLINPVYNPCGQPRMAIGYSIFSQLSLLARLKLVRLNELEVKKVILLIKSLQKQYALKTPLSQNPAKKIAEEIEKKVLIFVAAEHLEGAVHVFNNQMNENAKHFSDYRIIPELNHYLMEGLAFPETNKQSLEFLFINSPFYQKRNQQRFQLTEEVVKKNKIVTRMLFIPGAKSKLEEAFGLITLGAFISFYTAMKHSIDPAPIPWVDFFKQKLKEMDE